MVYGSITASIFIIGFAFIIFVLANKESGNIKLAGQIIAALVALVAIVVLFYGLTGRGCCGMRGCGMMGSGMMGGKGMKGEMMMNMVKKNPSMMQDMCKNPEMRKMMQDALKKTAK